MADRYVNPPPGGVDGLAVLAEAGWGVMQLPAADYPAGITARVLAEVAEQGRGVHRHGYGFVLVGDRDGLAGALGATWPGRSRPDHARRRCRTAQFLGARPARRAPPARSRDLGLRARD